MSLSTAFFLTLLSLALALHLCLERILAAHPPPTSIPEVAEFNTVHTLTLTHSHSKTQVEQYGPDQTRDVVLKAGVDTVIPIGAPANAPRVKQHLPYPPANLPNFNFTRKPQVRANRTSVCVCVCVSMSECVRARVCVSVSVCCAGDACCVPECVLRVCVVGE